MEAGSGLTFTEFTIAPAVRGGFGRWHSDEHAAERLAIPGVVAVRRYVSAGDPLRYCCVYRANTVDVFAAAAYQALFKAPSDLTRHMLAHLDGVRFVGSIVREAGGGHAGAMCRVRIASPEERDAEVLAWFDGARDRLLALPGVVRVLLACPRRDHASITDPSWICLVEGHEPAALDGLAAGGHGFGAEASAATFRLQHLMP